MSNSTREHDLDAFYKDTERVLQQHSRKLPETLSNWLGRLTLLYGMPFINMVPDERMLPPESIRFFYLDSNWLEALVDGAFSIGVHSNRDIRYHRVLQPIVRGATKAAAGSFRRRLRGEEVGEDEKIRPGQESLIRTGFLLRSFVVSGWPGLEVAGFRSNSESEESDLEILRLERLSPTVMLCIFEDIPDRVEISEPAEDLHFGFSFGKSGSIDEATVALRHTEEGEDVEPGKHLDPGQSVPIPWRNGGSADRVIDVAGLQAAIKAKLPGKRVGAADFAVHMVTSATKVQFNPDP